MRTTRLQLAAGAIALTFAVGCASVSPLASHSVTGGAEKRPKMIRTQVGNQVTLQWNSEPGIVYGVVYSTNISDNRSWRLLSGFDRIVGNGGMQKVTFTAPVTGQAHYRLRESHVAPALGR